MRTIFLVIPLTIGVGSCAPADDSLDRLFSGDLTVIDLTHALSADSPYWPNPAGNPFSHDTLAAHESGAPSMAAYSTPEHKEVSGFGCQVAADTSRNMEARGPCHLPPGP